MLLPNTWTNNLITKVLK